MGFHYLPATSTKFWSLDESRIPLVRHHTASRTTRLLPHEREALPVNPRLLSSVAAAQLWRHPPAQSPLPFTGRTVFLFKASTFDDAALVTAPPPVQASPCLGPAEGSGTGGDVSATGSSASEAEIPGLKNFGISARPDVGSGERMVKSGEEIQKVTNVEEEKTGGTHLADKETPRLKPIKDPLYNWDENQTSRDNHTDELGTVGKPPEVAISYRLYATKRPLEVDLEEAVQDLSYHRCSVGQQLELRSSGEGHLAKADRAAIDEFVRILVSCEEQANELHSHRGVWENGPHTVRSMTFIDPLEEISAPTILHNTVLLGEWKCEQKDPVRVPRSLV